MVTGGDERGRAGKEPDGRQMRGRSGGRREGIAAT